MKFFSELKLKYKITLLTTSVIIISSVIYTVLMYVEIRKKSLKEIDEKLLIAVELAKLSVPPKYHDIIVNKTSVSPSKYKKITAKYDKLCLKYNLEYLWSLIKIDNDLKYTSGTSLNKKEHKNYAKFLETHSNPEVYTKAFSTMKPQYAIIKDKWGLYRSILVPFHDSKGRKYLFGASISLQNVNDALDSFLFYCIIILILLIIVSSFIGIILSRSITAPIYKLIEKSKEMSLGNFDKAIDIQGSYELNILAEHFNLMLIAVEETINEVQKAETKAKITSRTLESFIDVIPHVFYSFKIDGQLIIWNKTLEKETGYNKSEIIQMKATDFFDKDDIPIIEASIKKIVEHGHDTIVSTVCTKDKRKIPFSFTGNLLTLDDGTPYAIVGVGTNISSQVEAEQQLKLQAERLSEITHKNDALQNEISNGFIDSVNKILMYSEHITKDVSDDTALEDAKNINQYGLNLLKQINKIFKSSNSSPKNKENE